MAKAKGADLFLRMVRCTGPYYMHCNCRHCRQRGPERRRVRRQARRKLKQARPGADDCAHARAQHGA